MASITPQARASLAERFGLSPAETHARLLAFLRERQGVQHLVDSSLGADFSLLEAGEEFVQRWRSINRRGSGSEGSRPQPGAAVGEGAPARPPLATWVAPPPTVALSSTRRFNVELGKEEDNVMQQQGQGQDSNCASGIVSGKRGREGEGAGGDPMAVAVGGGECARRPRGPGELLVLTSACPGWVCYAEKTAPEALPFMSTVKSPQQV